MLELIALQSPPARLGNREKSKGVRRAANNATIVIMHLLTLIVLTLMSSLILSQRYGLDYDV